MPSPPRRTVRHRTPRSAPAVLLALVLAALTACGSSALPGAATPEGPAIVVEHGLGRAEIPGKPRRVLAVGSGDVQMARALGAEIVGTTRNPSSPDGNWPAVSPPLPAEVMNVDLTRPNLELIAALRPDLILITQAQPGWTEAYPWLARIAPTIAYLDRPLEDDGGRLLEVIGRALGESERARTIAAASDQRIARFRAAHPGLEGRRVAFGQYTAGTTYLVVTPTAAASRFLGRLGLRLPDAFAPVAAQGVQLGLARFGSEQLGVLDQADIAFVSTYGAGGAEQFAGKPVLASTQIERTGNLHRISVDLAGAMLTPNPATTGFILDGLEPLVSRSRL